jgi:c-di-GMP-binding flagellar brake protein YcgR
MIEANLFTEKRTHPRIQVKIGIKFHVIDEQKEIESILERRKKEKDAKTMDISLGGMYVVSDHLLRMGNILKLDIPLSNDGKKSQLRAFAEVVWANETGAGLRFLTMKDSDTETLRTYLDKLSYPSGG